MAVLTVLGILDVVAGLTLGSIAVLTNDVAVARTAVPIAAILVIKGILSVLWD